jgi:hypothetical protein
MGMSGAVRGRAVLAALVLVLLASGALRLTPAQRDEVTPGWEARASSPEDYDMARAAARRAGAVWVDDFDLEVVWPSVKVTGQPTQPTPRTHPLRQGLPLRPVNPAFEEGAVGGPPGP